MKFDDYAGDISIDTSHLRSFTRHWYSPEDMVVLVAISVDAPRRKVFSQTVTARELSEISSEELDGLCQMNGEKFNTYLSCFPVKDDNNVSFYSRGTKEDIKEVFGVFADLDVKEGAFESKEEIRDFLYSLDVAPTVIIDNGSKGGVHAYWRLNRGEFGDEELLDMWWCYLSTKTSRKIDRLKDSTRILRLPSGVYWGKDGGSDTVKVVRVDGPTYPLEQLRSLATPAFEDRKKKIQHTIQRDKLSKEQIGQIAVDIFSQHNGTGFSWSTKIAVSKIEELINNELTWDEILVPHGWEHIRTLRDDTNEWARPGQGRRSAVTDYTHEDGTVSNVMSLLSQSDDTGLLDLIDAQIPLTKYRVLMRLQYNDDERAMLLDMKDRLLK